MSVNRIRNGWFQRNAQQSVFRGTSSLPVISATGPVQIISNNAKSIPQKDRYFVVGKSIVGGKEVVGG